MLKKYAVISIVSVLLLWGINRMFGEAHLFSKANDAVKAATNDKEQTKDLNSMQIVVSHNDTDYTLQIPRASISAEAFIQIISKSALPSIVKDALVVRLADNEVDMYGRTLKDDITTAALNGHTRYSMQVHPYPWQPSGASNVVVYKNEFNELSVALVYNRRRDNRSAQDPLRAMGVPSDWRLPEGYMHPKPCKGGENGIARIGEEDMDEAEELKLKKWDLETAYRTILSKSHAIKGAPSSGYDKNIRGCALRELKEEIGLLVPENAAELVTVREENAIVGIFLVHANTKNPGPPLLKVDGTEIAEAIWGKMKAFQLKNNPISGKISITLSYYTHEGNEYPVEVPMRYALTIGKAVQHFRDKEIQSISRLNGFSLFTTRESVEAKMNQILKSKILNPDNIQLHQILGLTPEGKLKDFNWKEVPGETQDEKTKNLNALAHLGIAGEEYHQKVYLLARLFTLFPVDKLINVNDLIVMMKEYAEIDKNIASGHVHSTLKNASIRDTVIPQQSIQNKVNHFNFTPYYLTMCRQLENHSLKLQYANPSQTSGELANKIDLRN